MIASTLKLHAGITAFLVACLHRTDLDTATRLAAASALTRSPEEAAFETLKSERNRLNRLDEGLWGNHFLELAEAKRSHEERMALIDAISDREIEERKDDLIAALTTDRPFACDDLIDPPVYLRASSHNDIRQAVVDSLVAISRELEGCGQPWNTYSNTAFKLDRFLKHERPRPMRVRTPTGVMEERLVTGGGLLRSDEYLQIAGSVRRFIAGRPPLP